MTIAFFVLLTLFFGVLWFLYWFMSALDESAGGLLSVVTRGMDKPRPSKDAVTSHLVLGGLFLASLGATLWSIFS